MLKKYNRKINNIIRKKNMEMLAYIKTMYYLCSMKLKNNNKKQNFMETSITKLRKMMGVSYLGGTQISAKMMYSYQSGTETYCVYLAPADLSGYNVCPNSASCKAFCLNASGHNKAEMLKKQENSMINLARIKKTKCFFENKELFMELLIKEIKKAREHALKNGLEFSVRLNGTSDLSPEDFVYKGENILEIFSDVQFYDYTKVHSRLHLIEKYKNYDLTLSYNGYNWGLCHKFLQNGGKVAVVFEDKLPKKFNGVQVIDANGYDMRYLDPKGTIMGLHYHKTAYDYKKGTYVKRDTKFVVSADDVNCEW